jgi:hypothetical protein
MSKPHVFTDYSGFKIKLEKNKVLPPVRSPLKRRIEEWKEQLKDAEVGDSFLIQGPQATTYLRDSFLVFSKETGIKLTSRTEGDGWRMFVVSMPEKEKTLQEKFAQLDEELDAAGIIHFDVPTPSKVQSIVQPVKDAYKPIVEAPAASGTNGAAPRLDDSSAEFERKAKELQNSITSDVIAPKKTWARGKPKRIPSFEEDEENFGSEQNIDAALEKAIAGYSEIKELALDNLDEADEDDESDFDYPFQADKSIEALQDKYDADLIKGGTDEYDLRLERLEILSFKPVNKSRLREIEQELISDYS